MTYMGVEEMEILCIPQRPCQPSKQYHKIVNVLNAALFVARVNFFLFLIIIIIFLDCLDDDCL